MVHKLMLRRWLRLSRLSTQLEIRNSMPTCECVYLAEHFHRIPQLIFLGAGLVS
jgi:hypothetical protein